MEDLLVLLLLSLVAGGFLVYQLFVQQKGHSYSVWERLTLQRHLLHAHAARSFHTLDPQSVLAGVDGQARAQAEQAASTTDNTRFVLSSFSLPVHRSLWRIVEYVLSDFIEFWFVKISDTPDFSNDLRDVFDHAFNVLGERSMKIDWTRFIVTNVISNVNYLMRIYRLTEQELNSHNPFFAQTPEEARHRLIKAELLRNYKLHAAVSNPQAYLRKLSTALLSRILRSTDFRSETVRTLTRELVTTFVFLPGMSFVEPYWLNFGLVTALKAIQAANESEKEKDDAPAPPTPQLKHRSARTPHHTTSFAKVGYTSMAPASNRGSGGSKPSSRKNSPVREVGLFTMPPAPSPISSPDAEEQAALFGLPSPLPPTVEGSTNNDEPGAAAAAAAAASAASSAAANSTAAAPAYAHSSGYMHSKSMVSLGHLSSSGTAASSSSGLTLDIDQAELDAPPWATADGQMVVPVRKDSLLTQKMKQWQGEKAKRQEKKSKTSSRNKQHPNHKTLNASPSNNDNNVRFAASPPGGHHDIPPGLVSPSGAFHSPNHPMSPVSSSQSSLTSSASFLSSSVPSSSSACAAFEAPPLHELLPHAWEVRIIGAGIRFDPKPFVCYELAVRNGTNKWKVVKRYNKFEELHNKLKKAIPSFEAQLPKKHFFNNLDQQFIQNRKVELQTYLGQLMWNRTVQENVDMVHFLLPTPEDAKWAQGGSMTMAQGSTTPESSTNSFLQFFKNKDAPTPQTAQTPGTQQQSPALASARPALMMQHTMPAMHHSALNDAAAPDDDALFRSESSSHLAEAQSPGRGTRRPFASQEGANGTGSARPFHAASPPGSPLAVRPPAGTPSATRTYSADDTTTLPPSAGAAPPTSMPFQPPPSRGLFSSFTSSSSSSAASQPVGVATSAGNVVTPLGLSGANATPAPQSHAPSSSSSSTSSSASTASSMWEDKSLTDPLYLLVEEIFNLNGRGWVRRQATWVGKQLVRITMDDLVKARLNRGVESLLNEQALVSQIDWLTELIWPGGKLFEGKPPVTNEEKEALKIEALRLLKNSMPVAVRTLLGKEHCMDAMENLFEFLQMDVLLQHFAYSVLDSLVLELFPELDLVHTLAR